MRPAATSAAAGVVQRQPPAADRRRAGAAVGLEHVAVDEDLALAERGHVDDRPQRPADQALDLLGAPRRPAVLHLAADPLGRRPGQHRVLGGDPALAACPASSGARPRRPTRCTARACGRSSRAPSPSAISVKSRSKVIGRSSSGWRPSGRQVMRAHARRSRGERRAAIGPPKAASASARWASASPVGGTWVTTRRPTPAALASAPVCGGRAVDGRRTRRRRPRNVASTTAMSMPVAERRDRPAGPGVGRVADGAAPPPSSSTRTARVSTGWSVRLKRHADAADPARPTGRRSSSG